MDILSDSQALIKDLDGFQIHFKFVWEYYQSLEKMTEENRSKLVWVSGHMEIGVNELAD
jgi:ribonuclease HI